MKKGKKELSLCSIFGHKYNPQTGICEDCGDDTLLQSWKSK